MCFLFLYQSNSNNKNKNEAAAVSHFNPTEPKVLSKGIQLNYYTWTRISNSIINHEPGTDLWSRQSCSCCLKGISYLPNIFVHIPKELLFG